jgi:hypothetical protein
MLPSFLFTPAQLKAMEAAEIAYDKERLKRNLHRAEAWDLWKTRPPRKIHEPLIIKAETYEIGHTLFDVTPTSKRMDADPATFKERDGRYRYYHLRTLPGMSLSVPTYPDRDRQPDVLFTAPVVIPTLLFKDKYDGWKAWMGLSPAEIFSQRSGIKFCRGNTVIGGLGMGWFLSEVVKRGKSTRITVVEKEPALLDWFGNELCKKLGVDVICDDIWNVVGKQPAGTRYAIDIWPGWFEASYDRDLRNARQAGHDIWAWGSARGAQ